MSATDVEQLIATNGPRVRAAYGADYYAGWVAALRWVAEKEDSQ